MRSVLPLRSTTRLCVGRFASYLVAGVLALLLLPTFEARACPADTPAPGSPCGGSGVATTGNTSETQQGGGDPINLINGNSHQVETDMPALPGVLGLEVVRYYNSSTSGIGHRVGILGRGWTLSYETELRIKSPTQIEIREADGTVILFGKNFLRPTRYQSAAPGQGILDTRKTTQGLEYTWTWNNGRQLQFDKRGKLTQITAPTGEFVSLLYDARGWLTRVTDPQGRELHLNYLDKKTARAGDRFAGVQSIDTPIGRLAYEYGSEPPQGATADKRELLANLIKVNLPTHYDATQKLHPWANRGITSSSISRQYHYEDARHPTLMTGITVSGTGSDGKLLNQRLVIWAYDYDGRANLSVAGEPLRRDSKTGQIVPGTGNEQITLQWRGPGTTLLTNSLGQTTRYRSAFINGQPRLTEVTGPGCATCGPSNIRYGYDRQGRLTDETTLDQKGQPQQTLHKDRDGDGRIIQISRITYKNGKAQPAQWQEKRLYRPAEEVDGIADDQPIAILRPSVISGKEHRIDIAYNDAGQPTSITERGYAPEDIQGKGAIPIVRATIYRYERINGRSVLTEIDGPLPNGPKNSPEDSDITRLAWDQSGNRVVGMTVPGNFASSVDYDDAGRVAKVQNDEGVQSGFEYDARNQLIAIRNTSPGSSTPKVTTYLYNALGQRTEQGKGDTADKTYRPQTHFAWDILNRPLWSASALGILERNRFDTESRLVESTRQTAAIAQTQRYDYDDQGRITQVADNAGRSWRIAYNAAGQPETLSDSWGRSLDIAGQGKGMPVDTSRRLQHLKDDFGRIVATVNPDSGTTRRSFDQADRLIASTDALGNQARYDYDAVGRIQHQAITTANAALAERDLVTEWKYAGRRLIALEHPTQSERYSYNQRGLLIAKTTHRKQADGSEFTSIIRYTWDDQGTLQSIGLPDGSAIAYQRNGQGQVVAVKRHRLQTSWMRWLLPSQTIVKGIERDLIGTKHMTAGNGIDTTYRRSKEGGILAQVIVRQPNNSRVDSLNLPGIGNAHAADTSKTVTTDDSVATKALLGALGLPADPRSLIDHRYLWDTQGNLLYQQDKADKNNTASYAYDRHNRLIAAVHTDGKQQQASRYYFDAQGRRLLSQESIADQSDLETNTRKALYEGSTHRWLGNASDNAQAAVHYDSTGQPTSVGQRHYQWDALGRLITVSLGQQLIARYTYNHRGERIRKDIQADKPRATGYLYEDGKLAAELNAQGKLTRQYLYLGDQPIAVIDTKEGRDTDQADDSLTHQLMRDLRTLAQAWFGKEERLVWLHANHLGAIEAATDEEGKAIWRADYQPFGQVRITKSNASNFDLNLRLPGQVEDKETGLYYNGHRYYDPTQGRYLTPDPLGMPDGPNPYAYVRGNPLRYIDPTGLVLFAFDGTGNTNDDAWLAQNDSSYSNVWNFYQLYQDGNRDYVSGVGTVYKDSKYGDINPSDYVPWYVPLSAETADMGGNYSGAVRIQRMVQYFNDESELADDNTAMDVDIVGFSRGAAEARDFANRIVANTKDGWYSYTLKDANGKEVTKCQKVNFRFMGLFDTVLSTNYSGYSYNLGIPDAFTYVAQAVALNEQRGKTLRQLSGSTGAFPLESIMGKTVPEGDTRIELGFIGAHADIGGGFGADENQLAQVALVWMLEQAKLAGVNMNNPADLHTIIANPVIHDKSDNQYSTSPTGAPVAPGIEDRTVRYQDGKTTKQMSMTGTGMTWADTQKFISYLPPDGAFVDGQVQRVPRADYVTGTVDMQAYLKWLNDQGFNIDMTVQ